MNHQWVRIVITPIHVVDDPEVSSQPVILITDTDEIEALECAQFGCIRCDEALSSETVNEPCDPDKTEDDDDIEAILRASSFGDEEKGH